MRFCADEFVVGNLIGHVWGTARVNSFGDVDLVAVDWDGATFCLGDDPAGEPVELTDEQRDEIERELRYYIEQMDPADCGEFFLVDSPRPQTA